MTSIVELGPRQAAWKVQSCTKAGHSTSTTESKKLARQKRQLHSDERKKRAAAALRRRLETQFTPTYRMILVDRPKWRRGSDFPSSHHHIFFGEMFSPFSLAPFQRPSRNKEIMGNCSPAECGVSCGASSPINLAPPRGAAPIHPVDRPTDRPTDRRLPHSLRSPPPTRASQT